MQHRDSPIVSPALLLGASLLAIPAIANADSGAGAATIDQQVHILVADDALQIEYATQLNRPAAFAEVLKIDANRDGRMTEDEQAAYFGQLAEQFRRGLEVRVNGRTAELLLLGDVQLEMPFRKIYRYRLPHPDRWQAGAAVELHNENYLNYTGQLVITLQPGNAIDVVYNSLAADDAGESDMLLPDATLQGQAQQRDIVFCYRAGSGLYDPDGEPELASRLIYTAEEENRQGEVVFVPPHPDRRVVAAWLVAGFCFVGGALVGLGWRKSAVRRAARVALAMVFLLAGCAGVCVAARLPDRQDNMLRLSRAEAVQQFQRLHRGVYCAFGQRSEGAVYDRLSECLAGDALDTAYNEVYEAVLDGSLKKGTGPICRNGPKGAAHKLDPSPFSGQDTSFSVRRVKPIETVILPPGNSTSDPHYRVRYRWRVGGTVTHFNHTHARVNEYAATYTVSLREGVWRITDVQMRQHKRLSTEAPAGRD